MTVVFPIEVRGADQVIKTFDAFGGAAKRAASQAERAAQKAEAAQVKSAAKIASAATKAEAAKVKAAEKAEGQRVRAAVRADAQILASAKRRISSTSRMMEREAKQRRRMEQSINMAQNDWRGGAARSVAMGAGGVALGALGTGAAVVGTAARDAFSLDEKARRISINSRQAGQDAVSPDMIREELEAVAHANRGMKAEDVGTGVGSFVSKTGDLDSALRYADLFAKVASATGESFENIANVGADLQNNLKIETLSEMETAMQSLLIQGKKGAIEFGDMSRAMAKPLAAAAAFGGFNKEEGTAKVGGLMQLAKVGGASSAEDASTAVARIFSGLAMETKRLDAAGVKTRDKDGNALPIEKILTDTIAKVGGNDMTKKYSGLTAIFGAEAIKAVNPMIATYQKTFAGTKGTDDQKRMAAEKAVAAQLEENMRVYQGSGEIVRDAALAQAGPSAQVVAMWETMVATVGGELIPVIAENAESISSIATDLIPIVGDGLQIFIGTVEATADTLGGFMDAVESSGDALMDALGIDAKKKTDRSETRAMVRASEKELRESNFAIAKAGGEDKASPEMLARRDAAKASVERNKKADEAIKIQEKREARQTGNSVVDTALTAGLGMVPGLGTLGAAAYTGATAMDRVDQAGFTQGARGDAEAIVSAAKKAEADAQAAAATTAAADQLVGAFNGIIDAFNAGGPAIERSNPIKK